MDSVNGIGKMFHVTGDIIGGNGMYYDERPDYCALQFEHLYRARQIGWAQGLLLGQNHHSLEGLADADQTAGNKFLGGRPPYRKT